MEKSSGNHQWFQSFEKARCLHKEKEASDHSVLLLDTNPKTLRKWGRFIFDKRWAQNQESLDLVKKEWKKHHAGSAMFRLKMKIKECRLAFQKWSKKNKSNAGKDIRLLKQQLHEAKTGDYTINKDAILELKHELSLAYKEE